MPKLRLLAATLCLAITPLCHADLKAGMDAYYAKDYAKAEAELRPLAEMGDPDANYFLGEVWRVGYNNKGDYMAYRLLARAARANNQAAIAAITVMRNKGMISLMWEGYQMRPEEVAVFAPIKAAADDPNNAGKTSPDTLARLATAYCDQFNTPGGKGGPVGTYPEVNTYLSTAAQAGQPQAEFNLGMSQLVQTYCFSPAKHDVSAGIAWLRKAGDHGIAQAQVTLANLAFYQQPGMSVDPKEGLERLKLAAQAGSPEAYLMLGQYYERGVGTTVDWPEAARWYRKAAEVNHPGAFSVLGAMVEEGKGEPKSQEEALKLYRRGAELGDIMSEKHLAMAYLRGQGVEKDLPTYNKWVQVAAQSGDAGAQFQYAINLFSGNGTKADAKAALDWLRDAANKGMPFAQLYLGELYAAGQGPAKDPGRAYGLYLLVLKNGPPQEQQKAQSHIDALKPSLTPEQITFGEKLAQVWAPDTPLPGSGGWRALSRKRGDGFEF